MNESDEDRRIAEAKATRIQKYQGAVPFLPLWDLPCPESLGWRNNIHVLADALRMA